MKRGKITDRAREEIMNEHERQTTLREDETGPETVFPRTLPVPEKRDLVVDLTGITRLDLKSLALLLTAQQQAAKEDRKVWLAGVPLRIWKALDDMGLGRFFRFFPVSGEMAV